ncbi:MAG: class I tRNA ligase family protein [Nanoarchaeota archaeon]
MKKIADKINFYPESSRKILDDWIDSVSIDWPISRRRFYATPIPLWKSGDLIALPKQGKYYTPWKEDVPKDVEVYKNGKKIGIINDFKNKKWVGEERVFDTWMDSSISELFILKYKKDDDFFKKAYPCNLRPQGKEIVRTWLYYTILRGYLETKKPCFSDVWINQHIVDSKGNKMSKSKGNVVDPQVLLKKYGGEAIRFWAAIEGDLAKQDLKCSEEKINAELKTLNKILNVSKFVMIFEKPKKQPKLTALDQLFTDYIERLTDETDKSYTDYDFYHPAIKLRMFLWEIFASHYIEVVKARAYNSESKFSKEESESAKYTLHFLLERFLYLSYPIIPQITTLIAEEKGISLLKSDWPKSAKSKKDSLALIEKIMEFNSLVWKTKKEKGLSLRSEIKGIKIPKELEIFNKDLIIAHNIV